MKSDEPTRGYQYWLALGHRESTREPDACRKCGIAYDVWATVTEPLGCEEVLERTAQLQDRLKKELNEENTFTGY